MKKKIYWNMCLIALAVIMLFSISSTVAYYNRLGMQMKREVIAGAKYLQSGMELSGSDCLTAIAGRTRGGSRNCITLIGADGTVSYDSYASNDETENHGDRLEVLSAFGKGSGENTRFPETLTKKTYYYAVLLNDGTVACVVNTIKSVLASVLQLISFVAVLAAVVLVLSMALAGRQTERIVKLINELDLGRPEENHIYGELVPLAGKMERQQRTTQNQIDTSKARQREFAAIAENVNEGFIVVGKETEVAFYNISAIRILGVDEQHAKENGVSILNSNHSQIFRRAVDDTLDGIHSECYMDIAGRCYQTIANPVMDGGEVSGAIIVILDVTEKQKRKGPRREFSTSVSHELKTPLTSISDYVEIMRNGLVEPKDMKRFSENIHHKIQRMITLIGGIIELSRLDENQVDSDKSQVDLYQIAFGVTERPKGHAKNQNMKLELEGESAVVNGTGQIPDEMIYNFCDSEVEYNWKDGSVTITVGWESGRVYISASDTGVGIPEVGEDRVFERFYRVDKNHSQQIGGTRLRLPIVKRGATYRKTQVLMDSWAGVGTTTKIVF